MSAGVTALKCPDCKKPLKFMGDGRHVCERGCGEWLDNIQLEEPALPVRPERAKAPWPELYDGAPKGLRQAMVDVANIPLGVVEPGQCQGHGGKGGGRKGSGGKSPQRQKYDAWRRKTSPGLNVRTFRPR